MAKAKKNAKRDTKPKQDPNTLNLLGIKAQALATTHQAKIGLRLTPVFLESFAADLAGLLAAVPAVITSRHGQIQLTAAQTATLLTAYNLVKGVKTTVKGHHPEKDVLLAYGVGAHMSKLSVSDVTAAVQKVLARVAAEPDEAASFDLIEEDVKALKDALQAVLDADQAQEQARAAAPLTTAQRNTTARRILAGIKKIAGAGMRAFVDDATVYANFEALITKAAS